MILYAQDQCAITLNEAEDQYEQGRLYEVPDLLKSCLENGFSQEEKIRAYRLLTLSYLFLDYYAQADSAYLNLLKLSPEYETNEELDPMEIINHHQKFTTRPIYYLTIGKLGINFSTANVLLDYSISQSANNDAKYSTVLGFHAGFGGEMVVYENLHVSGEFFLSRNSIRLSDSHWDFYKTNLDINHTAIELPIMLKYNITAKNVLPFVSAGISPSFLVESNIRNVEGVYTNADGEFALQTLPEINSAKFKKTFNYSLLFGGGINYKIGLNYLVFEARYAVGMLNVSDVKNRWREDFEEARDLKFHSAYVSDDFKFNSFSFLIGFVKPIYKPRKIR
jgi:hypothetical protein